MKIEDQVCTLEQAKKLKELSIDQGNNILYYVNDADETTNTEEYHIENSWGYDWTDRPGYVAYQKISAFTITELAAMMPTHITFECEQYFFQLIRGSKRWLAEWHTNKKDLSILSDGQLDRPRGVLWNTYKGNEVMAIVFADWIIALIENQIIDADNVNQRLINALH